MLDSGRDAVLLCTLYHISRLYHCFLRSCSAFSALILLAQVTQLQLLEPSINNNLPSYGSSAYLA